MSRRNWKLRCIHYNRALRFVNDYGRKWVYRSHGRSVDSFGHRWGRLQMTRLIVFTDAGCGSLTGSHSVEGSVDVLSEVVSRDGFISCQGTLTDRRCAKIQRVAKSSFDDEGHAALTSADQALRMQALLQEIATGTYNIRHISPPSDFPLPDPCVPSPTNEEVKWKRRADNSKRRISRHFANPAEHRCRHRR